MHLEVARRDTRAWRAGVRLAQRTYQDQFDARINPAPDAALILSEQDPRALGPDDELDGAVAGLTFANQGLLFAEHYLDVPIETALAPFAGEELSRSQIVEVGPLASSTTGAGGRLVSLLGAMCWCQGAKAAVFTVTRPLHVMLRRSGIRTEVICNATEARLPAELRGDWGRYYALEPVTVYTDVNQHMGEALSLLSGQSPLVGTAGRA